MHISLVLRFFYISAKGQKCAENSDIRFYLVKFTSKVSEVIIFCSYLRLEESDQYSLSTSQSWSLNFYITSK